MGMDIYYFVPLFMIDDASLTTARSRNNARNGRYRLHPRPGISMKILGLLLTIPVS
jgi:hypothetical protein